MFTLVDSAAAGFPLLIIGLFEIIAVNWAYGKIELMKIFISFQIMHTKRNHFFPGTTIDELIFTLVFIGFNRFSDDIVMMIGRRPNIYFRVTWVAAVPVILTVSLLSTPQLFLLYYS